METPTPRNAFTLLELLISMALAGVVITALASTFLIQSSSYEKEAQVLEMQENARGGMQLMTRELMMAGYDPTFSAGAGIVSCSAASIRFTMDLNGDGDVTDTGEDITYALAGNLLTRKAAAADAPAPLAENIQALTFTCYDASNNVTAIVGNIRKIRVVLTVRTSKPDPNYAANNGYRTETLTSDVVARNLGLSAGITSPPPPPTTTTTTTTTTSTSTTTTSTSSTTTTTVAEGETTTTTTTSTTTTTTTVPVDSIGPQITNITQTPSGYYVGLNATPTVCADVTDPSGVVTVSLYTNHDGTITMTNTGGDTYCATIPKHNNQTVNYAVLAVDALGNESVSTVSEYYGGTP